MQLSKIATLLGVEFDGPDVEFNSVSIDTRTLQPGDLYIAIKGLNFDGGEFLTEAAEKGAIGAITHGSVDCEVPCLQVADTVKALGVVAHSNRNSGHARILGITGSQGKTTVKEMLGRILQESGNTLVTRGNLNNEIGVPLTLLGLNETHDFGVIEMGANHAGEIGYIAALAEPDVAVITNAGRAHLEGFGSPEGVADAKGEIIDALKPGGTMVLNRDDRFYNTWKARAGSRKTVGFSVHSGNGDYCASELSVKADGGIGFTLTAPQGECRIEMKLLGQHNVGNALSAAAVALEAGASLENVVNGLGKVSPITGRLTIYQGINESRVIDDSYNASPDAFRAAIDVLKAYEGIRVLIMGDLAELGHEAESIHAELGEYAAAAGLDYLWSYGQLSRQSAKAFGNAAIHFDDKTSLVQKCREFLTAEVTTLVKGSRRSGMNDVVKEIIIN